MGIDLAALNRGLNQSAAPAAPATPAVPVTPLDQPKQEVATLEASTTPQSAVEVATPIPQVIEGPENFQEVLDNFDSYAAKVMEYDELTIPLGRRYVQTIMVALKTNPEYDGILVARDVHNVMSFIRASKNMTEAGFVVTNKKREVRAAKKKASVFDADMLSELSVPTAPTTRQAKPRKPNPFLDSSLDDFAALDTDSIDIKLSRDEIK